MNDNTTKIIEKSKSGVAKKKPNGKRMTGRPSKYDPKRNKTILDFFQRPYFSMIEQMKSYNDKTGAEKEYTKPFPVDFPTIERFCVDNDISDDTLLYWARDYPEFQATLDKCKKLAKDILIVNGLNGLYKEGFAKFVGINYFPELKDKQELSGPNGGPIQLGMIVLPQRDIHGQDKLTDDQTTAASKTDRGSD